MSVLLIASALAFAVPVTTFATNSWTLAASLATGRIDHTATRLASGKVLVAGGYSCTGNNGSGCDYTASAELYDPASDSWSTAGNLAIARSGHTATLLNSGKVLIVGGAGNTAALAAVELYDPASNTWTAAASLHVGRQYHTATLLPSGKVLVAGGGSACSDGHCTGDLGTYPIAEPTTELYDPATDTWTVSASVISPRAYASATLLASGAVLLAGGIGCDATLAIGCVGVDNELYDPGSNTWTLTGSYYNAEILTLTLLTSGNVVAAGGIVGGIGYQTTTATSAVYAPAANAWTTAGNLNTARSRHTASLMTSGQVLVVGGTSDSGNLASTELYDPIGGVWYTVPGLTLNTARSHHTATTLLSGQILVIGGYGSGLTTLTSTELYDPALGTYTVTASGSANGSIAAASQSVTAGLPASFTITPDDGYHASVTGDTCSVSQISGTVWTSAPINANCQVNASFSANAGNGLWSSTGSMSTGRVGHTATALASGKVLVASAGSIFDGFSVATAELYDPIDNSWSAAGTLITARFADTATLLSSGKVLVAGGSTAVDSHLSSAELYDPASNTWSAAGSMATARFYHTATLLQSGKVLVAGGGTNTAELYDPASNMWSPAGNLSVSRIHHTATLLASGKVLVAGGPDATAELYDPASNTWSTAASLATTRSGHTATLLSSGKVLVVGGISGCNGNGGCTYLASAAIYDPASNTWSSGGGLATSRSGHSANLLPSGQVLIAGGTSGGNSNCDNFGDDCAVLASAELYDPAGNSFSPTASLITARNGHTATLLSSGDVLAVGGLGSSDNLSVLSSAEIYGPASNVFSISASAGSNGSITPMQVIMHRGSHALFTITPTAGYHASVSCDTCSISQITGNRWATGALGADGIVAATFASNSFAGTWSATGSLATARELHSATLLNSGKVLVAGGASGAALNSAELYDPAAGTWSAAASMNVARAAHTATLLPSGKVLVAGGGPLSAPLAGAEIYDPATNIWTPTGNLAVARTQHAAVLLASGKVLVVGGLGGSGVILSSEIFDPATNTWTTAGSLSNGRWSHTATVLASGKILVVGGRTDFPSQQSFTPPTLLASAELFDPATLTWSSAGNLNEARAAHTATLLPSGRVLIVAGEGDSGFGALLSSAEQYDPGSNSWHAAGGTIDPRSGHTATLSPSGQVLIAGGSGGEDSVGGYLSTAELYDPASNSFSATASLIANRTSHSATLLPSGQVLAVGGFGVSGDFNYSVAASAELYGAANSNVFAISTLASPAAGGSVTCTPNPITGGTTASCTALASAGYALASISGCGGTATTNSPYVTAAISSACTVTATFSGGSSGTVVSITTVASPANGGSVVCSPNPVTTGSTAICTATPTTGYALTNISGCDGTNSNSSPYTTGAIGQACTVTAVFSLSSSGNTVPITTIATPNASGGVTCTPNPVSIGSVSTCTALAASGYAIGSISGCAGNASARSPYSTGTITAACTVTASFTTLGATTWTVSAEVDGRGGSIGPSLQTVDDGSRAMLTVSPNAGFAIASVTGCGGVLTGSTYTTAVVRANCNVSASFAATSTTHINLTSSPNPSTANQTVVFVATVTESASNRVPINGGASHTDGSARAPSTAPTGSVTFSDNNRALATITLDNNGMATYSVNGFSVGTHNITATFSGGGSSSSLSQQVLAAVTTSPTVAVPAPALSPMWLILLSLALLGFATLALHRNCTSF